MAKIEHGIDLGTTNSAVSKLKNGDIVILKNDVQKDTTESCVFFTRKQATKVGLQAYNQLKSDRLEAWKKGSEGDRNTFEEFKRVMGSEKKYESSHMGKSFLAEELSAEVLKALKTCERDSDVKAAVITIPAMFNDNQKAATVKAAELAGLAQVELLQEPIAAAMTYGLETKATDEDVVVFDFGGGTFDVAYINFEDGVLKVKDTMGDNLLGGKNLDEAIVHKILIPELEKNFNISSYDDNMRSLMVGGLKKYAEEVKIGISSNSTVEVYTDLGQLPNDDDGKEMEIDIEVSEDQMPEVIGPVFQKAIDITNKLIEKNNLDKSKMRLLLVGGPTLSPLLRKMLEEQICKPDTSIDPMTAVSKGAAFYALKFDLKEEIVNESRDRTKIQLLTPDLPASTVEKEILVPILIDQDNTDSDIPDSLSIQIDSAKGDMSTGKLPFSVTGDAVELKLEENKSNTFIITLFDGSGNKLDVQNNEFTIFQGIAGGEATIALGYGLNINDPVLKKQVFKSIKGLEKNKEYPAIGIKDDVITIKKLLNGGNDSLIIPIYQGPEEAEDTRAELTCQHVHDVKLLGKDIPRVLPAGSQVIIKISVDSDKDIKCEVEIPLFDDLVLEYKFEDKRQQIIQANTIEDKINSLKDEITSSKSKGEIDDSSADKMLQEVEKIESNLKQDSVNEDNLMKTESDLRHLSTDYDKSLNSGQWPKVAKELEDLFHKLKEAASDSDNREIKAAVENLKAKVTNVLDKKDISQANELKGQIWALQTKLDENKHGPDYWISAIAYYHEEFNSQNWTDRSKARSIVDQGMREAANNPTVDRMRNIVFEIWNLLPRGKSGGGDIGL